MSVFDIVPFYFVRTQACSQCDLHAPLTICFNFFTLVDDGRPAHSFLVALRAFAARIEAIAAPPAPAAPATLAVLRRLFALFGLYWLEKDMGDFAEDGYVCAAQAAAVRAEVRALLAELRPDACALTDAWDFKDFVLQSAIGRYDGDVYPALFESATRSVLNQAPRGPGWRAPITAPAPDHTMFTSADDIRAASTPGSKL